MNACVWIRWPRQCRMRSHSIAEWGLSKSRPIPPSPSKAHSGWNDSCSCDAYSAWAFPRSGLCFRLSHGGLRQRVAEDDNVYATVDSAASGGEVGGDRMILGESGDAQTIGSEAVAGDEEAHN